MNEKKLEIIRSFKKKYRKELAELNKLVANKEGIYGANVWTGCGGLPIFLTFDLNEALSVAIDESIDNPHPDHTRIEFISFGMCPEQKTVGYLY